MYKLLTNPYTKIVDAVMLVETITSIPFDLANTDYQAYLKWLEEGNQPLPPDET